MSRYLAFVLLALSTTSVLAAPAEIPPIPTLPATAPLIGPVTGSRTNTLHKRDWEYPASTDDCRLSSDSTGSSTPSYTHDGHEYSEACLSSLALSVPFEDRKSCRTETRGYDEECLFRKAFDEDWTFDLEKAKEDELTWRAAHPSSASSDAWRTQFPSAIVDCFVLVELLPEIKVEKRGADGGEEGGEDVQEGKREGTSDGLSGWSPYSTLPTGDTVANDCIALLVLRAKIVIDLGTCPADKTIVPKSKSLSSPDVAAPLPNHDLSHLLGRSSEELATRAIEVDVSVLVALRLDCLIDVVLKVLGLVGADAILLVGPLGPLVGEVVSLIASLLGKIH